jgi:uncharacterized FlaG/YvyC family protein
MKIGAGGLQSLASQDVVPLRRIEPAGAVRREDVFPQGPPAAEGEADREALVKAVGRLNQAAETFNQPLEFLVREDEKGKPQVELVDKESGETRAKIPPEVILEAAKEPFQTVGFLLDVYL